MKKDDLQLVTKIAQAIYDKKGSNIIALDVSEISTLTNYIIIAEGNVNRHVLAIANEVEKTLAQVGEKPQRVEGRQNGDWVVIDFSTIMVHLFQPGLREKYQLERMWSEGKLLPLAIDTSSPINP